MLRLLPKSLLLGLIALALPAAALANGVIQSMRGDVRANGSPVSQEQRFTPGTRFTTGADSQAVLRFDDGQQVVLNQNTEFRVVDFTLNADNPRQNRAVFDFVKGALRIVTGAIGRNNPAAFQIRAPQATIGVRGTDFMLTIVNPLYVSVLSGSIGATNAAGTTIYTAGQFGIIGSAGALGAVIPAGAVPAGVTSTFGAMGAVPGVGAGAAGAGAAGAAASGAGIATGTGGAAIGAAAAIGAVAVGAAAAASGNQNSATHH